ncbi:MAG TPA: glycosyltransferase family 2 protein, partial [Solirubrobacterales bacterium]|nr:glycosyltransferase family 2 protein [Solirubrobacterales bacterium]
PSQVGGVPLIEVEALAARHTTPYTGPDRRATRQTKVSVVVPAMNEAQNIGHVLSELPEGLHEVILVDGNSEDETIAAARQAYPEIRVLSQSGRGKGDAFRTGFAAVTGNLVVMLDADGSAVPSEIPRFVEALEAGADFAKGSRYLEGGGSADITVLRKLGNSVLSGTANLLHGTRFTDLCYGYNAFWTRCLPFISLDVPGFEVETLINLRIASAGMKITEVPSYEANRISGQSNLKTFRDGFRVLATIVGESRRRRSIGRVNSPVAGPAQAETASVT